YLSTYTIDRVADAYGAASLYTVADFGVAQYSPPVPVTIGVYELENEPTLTSDIAAWQQCFGTSANVTVRTVDGGATSDNGNGGLETSLDLDNLIGVAPQSNIIVYQGPNNDTTGPYDVYAKMINDDAAKVISTSWGLCEAQLGQTAINAEAAL